MIPPALEIVHFRREGRSRKQIAKKGKSNTRWIVGKLCLLVNHIGLIVGWACSTANALRCFPESGDLMVAAIQALVKKDWYPTNLPCTRFYFVDVDECLSSRKWLIVFGIILRAV